MEKARWLCCCPAICGPRPGRFSWTARLCPKGILPVQLIYQHPEKAINPRWRLRRVLEESGRLRPELLEALGIEPAWLDRFPRELSGGELQRFCVAGPWPAGRTFSYAMRSAPCWT